MRLIIDIYSAGQLGNVRRVFEGMVRSPASSERCERKRASKEDPGHVTMTASDLIRRMRAQQLPFGIPRGGRFATEVAHAKDLEAFAQLSLHHDDRDGPLPSFREIGASSFRNTSSGLPNGTP
jgi:hypothetical protein